jgi:hypothetical protein
MAGMTVPLPELRKSDVSVANWSYTATATIWRKLEG